MKTGSVKMKVIALIGDILSSRNISGRHELQVELKSILQRINQSDSGILSPYTITLGDEFQCVYSDATHLFIDIWEILSGIYPQKVRFSIGVGNLTTEINPDLAIGMDGPAFYAAREGIQELKKTSFLFHIHGEHLPQDSLLNQTLHLISHICSNWEKNRVEILLSLMKGEAVKTISARLGISTVAVYKNIHSGALGTILNIMSETTRIINQSLEKP